MKSNINQSAGSAFSKGKDGFSGGFGIAAVLTLYMIISPSRGPLLPDYGLGSISFLIFGIILPSLLGAGTSGFIVEAVIIKEWINGRSKIKFKKGIIGGAILCSILALPFGLFLGVIFSGWGGSFGGAAGELIHNQKAGIFLGLALLGYIIPPVIVTIVSSFGTIIGLAIDLLFNRILKKTS